MILLDIHGVLLDFHTAAEAYLDHNVDPNCYGHWDDIHLWPDSFWIDMPKLPWYHDLLELVHKYDEVCLCTKPTKHNAGAMQSWINYNLPNTKYIITAQKGLCQGILIDDCQEHNPSILFPKLYNFNSYLVGHELSYVESQLERYY
jgi:hypothetical protein